MHGKQQLITPVQWICLAVSAGLHALLLSQSGWRPSRPVQIELQQGLSAVELTLLPSVPSVQQEPEPVEPPPPPPPEEEPPPAPIVEEPAELSRPEPVEEPPPKPEKEPEPEQDARPEPETPQKESIEQDANLLQKGVETSALVIRPVIPRYPPLSRRRGEEGTVVITLTVTADGQPEDIRVSQSSHYPLLDRAALSAVRRSRFKPAIRNGKAVESSLEQPILFKLTNN